MKMMMMMMVNLHQPGLLRNNGVHIRPNLQFLLISRMAQIVSYPASNL